MSPIAVAAAAALAAYTPRDADQRELRETFLTLCHTAAEPCARTTAPAHLTASTLVVASDRSAVLLTHHAKANDWFQFGGHVDASDLTLREAAARECREESGLELTLSEHPVHLDSHEVAFCQPGTRIWHYDVRYVAWCPPDAVPTVSSESHDVRWWPLTSAPALALGDFLTHALA